MLKVAAVIPAYNEEKTVARVVEAARASELIAEVIVVDDGSTDKTAEVSERAGARVIRLASNVGKGGAMKAGAEATDAEVIVYLDADLVGLTQEHVCSLAVPVLRDEADITLGIFDEGRLTTDIAQKITPFLTGQRAIKRWIILGIPHLEKTRYGVEVAISRYAEQKMLRVARVHLKHVAQVTKEQKIGLWRGFRARLRMYWEIIRLSR